MSRTSTKPNRNTNAKPRTFGVGLLSAGAAALGIGAALVAVLLRRSKADSALPTGHAVPDLAADKPTPGTYERAPDHFRPDPTAPVPPEMRESLRPATGHAPGFAADRGSANATPQDAA
jgi:hypothetical protein